MLPLAWSQKTALLWLRKTGLMVWIWSMLLGVVVSNQSPNEKTLYLNSYAHCGNDNHDDSKVPYSNVDEQTVYNILDETSLEVNTRAWRQCEIVLRSARSDGRLCVLQRQLKFEMCHVKLELYDGWSGVDGVETPNKTADCDKGLMSVEWCTSSRYLTIGTKPAGSKPDVKHINIDLLVYDMRSPHRKAYMDSLPYCGSSYQLDSSRVTVSNHDSNYVDVPKIFPRCNLYFDYVGQDTNRSLCMVFKSFPKNNPNCAMNYSLEVSELTEGSTGKWVSRNVHSCQSPSPVKWCASGKKIQLELRREVTPYEPYGAFKALIMDHEGGPETLPFIQEEDPGNSDIPDSERTIIIVVVISCTCMLVVILVIVICVLQKRRSSDHRPVPGGCDVPNGTANVYVSCKQNGKVEERAEML